MSVENGPILPRPAFTVLASDSNLTMTIADSDNSYNVLKLTSDHSCITSVTVYLDGAVIKRSYDLSLNTGVTQVTLEISDANSSNDDLSKTLRIEKEGDVQLAEVIINDEGSSTFNLTTASPGTFLVHLIYSIVSTSWRPFYTISVNSGFDDHHENDTSLTYKAIVSNGTTETWNNVHLGLHHASVTGATWATTDRSRSWFIADDKVSITAGSKKKIELGYLKPSKTFKWTCTPSVDPDVYMQVVVKNSTRYHFYKGDAEVYLDGNFLRHFPVRDTPIGDYFDIPLGVDTTIKLDHQPPKLEQWSTSPRSAFDNEGISTYICSQIITICNSRTRITVGPIEVNFPTSTLNNIIYPMVLQPTVLSRYGDRVQISENVPEGCAVTVGWILKPNANGAANGYNWSCFIAPRATVELKWDWIKKKAAVERFAYLE